MYAWLLALTLYLLHGPVEASRPHLSQIIIPNFNNECNLTGAYPVAAKGYPKACTGVATYTMTCSSTNGNEVAPAGGFFCPTGTFCTTYDEKAKQVVNPQRGAKRNGNWSIRCIEYLVTYNINPRVHNDDAMSPDVTSATGAVKMWGKIVVNNGKGAWPDMVFMRRSGSASGVDTLGRTQATITMNGPWIYDIEYNIPPGDPVTFFGEAQFDSAHPIPNNVGFYWGFSG